VNRRAVGCLFEAAETLVLTLVIFLIIQNFVAQPYKVEQQSMEDTLQPGQYVLVDKLTPRFDPYKRGDIVVFTPPGGSDSSTIPFIKRVIGLGGDTVDILDGHVRINGQELREPYVFPGQTTQPTGGLTHYLVPDGDLFVMGDHRENSSDSRVFGPIPISTIIGRAWLRYWPIDTFSVLATPTYPILSPLVPSPGPSTGAARTPPRAAAALPAAAG
jgi:signal peptidase I